MGCTACTEPQCLYKGALYLYLAFHDWSSYLRHCVRCYVSTSDEERVEHGASITIDGNEVYLCLRDIDCKYPHLPHLDGYRCISVAKMWRNLTTCVEMPIVIPESIHKFNVCIK